MKKLKKVKLGFFEVKTKIGDFVVYQREFFRLVGTFDGSVVLERGNGDQIIVDAYEVYPEFHS